MDNYWDDTLNPMPPYKGNGVGVSPYPLGGADVSPPAPNANGDHTGASPYPIDSSSMVQPKADHHDGFMDIHLHQAKPGSFKP